MIVRLVKGFASVSSKALGLGLVLTAVSGVALANPGFPTPEIDAGSLASAVTLLVGGAFMLSDRIRRK
jgi:hypothetical protein